MSKSNAIAHIALICRGGGVKTALTSAVAAIAIAAALIGGGLHSQAHADSPTPSDARASQSPADVSQALRRYTLQLLHILSDADSNKWELYRQAIAYCAAPPTNLAEIDAVSDVSLFDATLVALTWDLCADLDRRLDEARTVGLLVNEPESMVGYVLIPGRTNNDVHLIDHLGRIAHSWHLENIVSHAKLLDNGNLLVDITHSRSNGVAEVDPEGNIIWRYTYTPSDTYYFHHDFLKMPNGNILILAGNVKTRDEAIAAGANPSVIPSEGMTYDYVIEVRPAGSEGGEIVWEWSAWDYLAQDFDPTKENYHDPSERPELIDVNYVTAPGLRNLNILDWLHTNSLDYNPALDQIMISPRQFSELWIIDHSVSTEEAPTGKGGNSGNGGALLYRWGNPRAYGRGTIVDQRLFRQHNTHWIVPGLPGAGNILVFNNGYDLDVEPRFYSSVEEIVPPVDGYGYRREPGKPYPPLEAIWTYTAETPTDFYARIIGGAQRLPNGNTLICESVSGILFQVTPDGKTVWKYVYPLNQETPLKQGEQPSLILNRAVDTLKRNSVYRAYWYAPDHPGLQKYDLTPGATIELYE